MSYQWLNNPTIYETTHSISKQMSRYIQAGFNYPLLPIELYDEQSDAIMYGILRGCTEVMGKSLQNKRNYVNIDHGYFTNRNVKPYFRITRNARHYGLKLLDLPDDRFSVHGVDIKDYNQTGNTIVILPPSPFWGQYDNIDYKSWGINIKILLETITDKEIIIKNKNDEKPLSEYLKNAYALVHYSSMGAIEALLAGIPVLTLGPSFLSGYTSTDYKEINNLKLFDRTLLFNNLAYHQFSINEVLHGTAKTILNEIYKELDNE